MDTYLKRTALWYGGVGLLAADAARNVALPRKYLALVLQEIETMGVRSLGVGAVRDVGTPSGVRPRPPQPALSASRAAA